MVAYIPDTKDVWVLRLLNKKKRPWWSPEKWVMILFPKVGLDFLIPKKLKEEKKEK